MCSWYIAVVLAYVEHSEGETATGNPQKHAPEVTKYFGPNDSKY